MHDFVMQHYKQLCQGALEKTFIPEQDEEDLKCYLDLWSKVEVLSLDPLVVLFHDVVSETLGRQIRRQALSQLEPPKTVSFKSGQVYSKSSTRAGKVAFFQNDRVAFNNKKSLRATADFVRHLLSERITVPLS